MAPEAPALNTPLAREDTQPFPTRPNFSGLVALTLPPLNDAHRTLLSAADQIAHAGDSSLESDTAADLAELAAVVEIVPESPADETLDTLEAHTDALGGELAARAGDLPAEQPPPDVDLPPPGDDFIPDDTAPAPPAPGPGPAPPPGDPRAQGFRDTVRSWYLDVLGREPDPDGWDVWVELLLRGDRLLDVYAAFRRAAQVEIDARG
jgi:hypothetical protein